MVAITLPAKPVGTVKLDYNASNNTFRAKWPFKMRLRRGSRRHDKMHLLSHVAPLGMCQATITSVVNGSCGFERKKERKDKLQPISAKAKKGLGMGFVRHFQTLGFDI